MSDLLVAGVAVGTMLAVVGSFAAFLACEVVDR